MSKPHQRDTQSSNFKCPGHPPALCQTLKKRARIHSRTHWLDPTSSASCSETTQSAKTVVAFIKENTTTVHLANVAALPPVTQPVQRCSGANMTQVARRSGEEKWVNRKKSYCCYTFNRVQCLWCLLLCVERVAGFSRDQVLYLSLAGSSGHPGNKGERESRWEPRLRHGNAHAETT